MNNSKSNVIIFAIVIICVGITSLLLLSNGRNNGDEPKDNGQEKTNNTDQNKYISLSTTNIVIPVGSAASFDLSFTEAVGRVDVSSNDASIASVDKDILWLESISSDEVDSTTINVTGNQVGTTQITINLADVATFDTEEELTGTYQINVIVE